jgi:methylenetetrahydrofolate dehydrogenase (NADP+)/methenyltetrahydrofolate cyclohydrolase
VIVGKGLLVGKPIAAWLSREGYSYEMIDREHVEGLSRLKDADIIISGTGVSSLIQPSMIKDGVVLFDAGTSTASGKLMGDIDPACYEKASIVSGVPGGIGPLTVVSLLRNLFLP